MASRRDENGNAQKVSPFSANYTVFPQKHVTTFSTITLTISVRLQLFLAQSVVSLGVIERWFHFPPHLSSATTLPWEITEHKKFKALSEGIHLQAVIGYREKIDRPTVG